jgi:glycosyltransferase involved in cell wall biosynthesis
MGCVKPGAPLEVIGRAEEYAIEATGRTSVRISIVMPTYNRPATVGRAVRSAAAQQEEGQELEIVIVDDSTDDTLEVAAKALEKFPSCKLVTHRGGNPRLRTNGARNRGIELATGDLFMLLDSDDELLPGALTYVREFFEAHPHVDALFASVKNKSGRPQRAATKFLDRIVSYEELVAEEKVGEFLPIVRRSAFMDTGVRFEQHLIGFEGIVWNTLARMGYRYYFSSRALRLYEDTGTDRTTNADFRIDRARVFALGHVQLLRAFGDDMRRHNAATYRRRIAKALLYNRLAAERDRDVDQFLKSESPLLYGALEIAPVPLLRRVFHTGVLLYGDT